MSSLIPVKGRVEGQGEGEEEGTMCVQGGVGEGEMLM